MTESPDAAEEHGQPSYDEESRGEPGEGTRQHWYLTTVRLDFDISIRALTPPQIFNSDTP
jgi:hypothetical protein